MMTLPKPRKPWHKNATNVKDMLGQPYNSWTVIEIGARDTSGHALVKVRCVCGNEQWRNARAIGDGKSKQCASCRSRAANAHRVEERKSEPPRRKLWDPYMHGEAKRLANICGTETDG